MRACRARQRLFLAVACLAARSGVMDAQRVVSAPRAAYAPGIDVLDYDIHLALPDTGAFIRGDVTVTVARARDIQTLRLDLVQGMHVRSSAVNGVEVHAMREHDALLVPLAAGAGNSVRVRVRYDGIVTDGLIVQRDRNGQWTWFGDNWPDRARHWLPTVDHPSDKATVSFTVRAPTERTVVANGMLLGVERLGGAETGRSETRWREARPIATYLMVIGAGYLVQVALRDSACVITALHRCAPQSAYASPGQATFLPGPFVAAPAIVSYFEELVGPFPYEKLAHLQSATRFGGMENASAIFYADRLFREGTLADGLIAHETAHQWFGDAVTEREWAHLWLSEGFATYFAALWTRKAHGEVAFAREMAGIRTRILGDAIVARRPVIDSLEHDYLALLNTNSYQKGAYVLFMLNQALGDDAFFAAIREYYRTHRDGTALTGDLQREFEATAHASLAAFFDQWLRRPGVPVVKTSWQFDALSGRVAVTVVQEGGVPPYALSIPVEIHSADGTISRERITVPASARTVIPVGGQYRSAPRSVRIDPDSLVLARITAS